MDSKTAQTLDPKLKEAYDRVMGTSLPQTPSSPTPAATTSPHEPIDPMSAKESVHAAPPVTPHVTAAHSVSAPTPAVHTVTQQAATSGIVSSGFVAPHEEKKSAVSGKLLLVAGVVFLIVYTLFWLKWFGVPLPFLP